MTQAKFPIDGVRFYSEKLERRVKCKAQSDQGQPLVGKLSFDDAAVRIE